MLLGWLRQAGLLLFPVGLLAGCQAAPTARQSSGLPAPLAISRLPPAEESWPAVPTAAIQPVTHLQPVEPPATPQLRPLPAPSTERDAELTLGQLEQMALAGNPSIAEAAARVDAARGNWVQVGLPPNPWLGYSGQQLGSGGAAEQQGLFVSQEFVRGGKLELNRAIASQEIDRAAQLLAAQQQRVLTDVRLAFYEVLVAQRRNETAEQLVQIAEQALETAKALLRAMDVSQIDVMRAQIELQTAQLLLKNSRNLHRRAWSRLAAAVGFHQLEPQLLVGDLESSIPEIVTEQAFDRLVSESPDLAAAMTEVQRARAAVDRAHAEPVPNVDVQAVVQHDNGTGSSNANMQISFPMPWWNQNQGRIRQAYAEVAAAERAVDRLEFSLRRRLAEVDQRYASARNQVTDYAKEDGILATSRTTLEFVRRGYQAGELSYLDLITAQRTFSRTNLAYIEALGELWAAVIEIEGLLLRDSLESDS